MADGVYPGRCHCGAIGFSYECSVDPGSWPVRTCQCCFCRSHDALSTSDSSAKIEFRANDVTALNRYRFGLMTADFLLCKTCGVYLGALIETPKGRFGIIYIRTLHPAPENLAEPTPVSYDGEVKTGRIARREERWSPVTGVPW